MTDIASGAFPGERGPHAPDLSPRRLKRRRAAERRFRLYGLAAIVAALGMLALLLASIVGQGITAFVATEIALDVPFDESLIDPTERRQRDALVVTLQRNEVVEDRGVTQLGGVDEAHEEIADARAVLGLVEHGVLAMQNGLLQRALHDVVV